MGTSLHIRLDIDIFLKSHKSYKLYKHLMAEWS